MDVFTVTSSTPVFQNYLVSPSMSLRFSSVGKAFQRYRVNSVTAYVTPQASATTNGGYVCGFVMDPADSSVTAPQLSATQGSQTKKWYETAIVRMPKVSTTFFTSPGNDPRLSSPGMLWVISEGSPQNKISVVVTFRWSVTLSHPFEEMHSESSFTLEGELRGKQNNYNLSYYPKGVAIPTDDFTSQIPETLLLLKGKHFFRVPTFTIEYSEGSGDTGTIQAHFIVYDTSDKKVYYSSNGTTIVNTVWQGNVEADQVCVPCGTFCKYTGQGEGCQVTRYRLPLLPSRDCHPLETRLKSLNERITLLELSSSESKNSLRSSFHSLT